MGRDGRVENYGGLAIRGGFGSGRGLGSVGGLGGELTYIYRSRKQIKYLVLFLDYRYCGLAT